MELSLWILPILIAKLLIYIGVSAAVGGVFVSYLIPDNTAVRRPVKLYICLFLSFALISTVLDFFLQVGVFSERGISGMWDSDIASILWSSNVGDVALYRFTGFVIALVALVTRDFLIRRECFSVSKKMMLASVHFSAAVLLVSSFRLVGHTAEMAIIFHYLISLHVFVAAWWMGALWPLWLLCRVGPGPLLQPLMIRFGQYAVVFVSILLICGGILAMQLISSITDLISTTYGQLIVAKLFAVVVILLVAIRHKFRLVPKLLDGGNAVKALSRSIEIEMLVGLGIFLITVVFTNVVGPEHAMR